MLGMNARVKRPASKLTTLKKAIHGALPGGLPKVVARFYAESDGLRVNVDDHEAVLVGLDAMFDGRKKGVFRAHQPVTKKDLDELELSGRPFYERFFNEHVEVEGKRGLDRLNLLLRLKLLSSVEGESVELAVDYFAGKEPELYLINRLDPYRLHLGFDDFVAYFSKFGTRRWYYAFLDRKAEQAMNIDLRAELEASLANFDPADVDPLLARFPKKRKAARPKPSTDAEEATEPSLLEQWKAEAGDALKSKEGDLWYPWVARKDGAAQVFEQVIESGEVSFEAVWCMEGLPSRVPLKHLDRLLAARRKPKHDQLWRRFAQLVTPQLVALVKQDPGRFERMKLDPLLQDVFEVVRIIAGVLPKGSASKRVKRAVGEWAFEPIFVDFAGLGLPGGLAELGALLVGDGIAPALVHDALASLWAKKKYRALAEDGVLLASKSFREKGDMIQLMSSFTPEVRARIARDSGWDRKSLNALADECLGGYFQKQLVGTQVPSQLRATAARL
jgi:hypothetical protein